MNLVSTNQVVQCNLSWRITALVHQSARLLWNYPCNWREIRTGAIDGDGVVIAIVIVVWANSSMFGSENNSI